MPSILSIAPMIQWTDPYWRYMMRQITAETLLYTEMTMDNAILYNQTRLHDFLGPSDFQGPLALQLGGSDPIKLADAACIAENYANFHEINLNCGCPSNKAKKAGFGAELMLESELVTRIMYEMKRKVTNTDLSVKCRLGVTGRESYDELVEFIRSIESVGIRKMVIHARSCVLCGLSPAQNRSIPPLKYDWVYRLCQDFPTMKFTINGGIDSLDMAEEMLSRHKDEANSLAGVMIGRTAYKHPWIFADADHRFFDKPSLCHTRREVLSSYLDYCAIAQEGVYYGSSIPNMLKPLHYFFHGAGQHTSAFKQKLDMLVKARDQVNGSMEDIVYEAIEGTIPSSFLDSTSASPPTSGIHIS